MVAHPAITAAVLEAPAPNARLETLETAEIVEPEQPNDAAGSPVEPFQKAGAASR